MRAAGVDTAALARYHLLHMERLRRGREDRRPVLGDPSLGILEIFDVKDATISLATRIESAKRSACWMVPFARS